MNDTTKLIQLSSWSLCLGCMCMCVCVCVTLPSVRRLSAQEEGQVRHLLREAVNLHQSGRLPEARKKYHELLKVQPRHAKAIHMLALICMQIEQDPKKVIGLFKKSLKLQPEVDVSRSPQLHTCVLAYNRQLASA